MLLLSFFTLPNRLVWVPVDRGQWQRQIEEGLPE